MTGPVVGVDPGGRYTGIVARSGDLVVWAAVITRDGDDMARYLDEVEEAMLDAVHACGTDQSRVQIAVEGLTVPSPHMGVIALQGLLDTAVVLGAVMGRWDECVVVPPGENGAAPLTSYPARLVGAREKVGAGKAVHARSAWDVAGKAGLYRALHR